MLRPRLRSRRGRAGALLLPQQRRSYYSVPKLEHLDAQEIPGLFSADGFNTAWTEHMLHLRDRLHMLTDGTIYQDKQLKQIMAETARQASQAALFNCASMAHNTHFFFRDLLPVADEAEADHLPDMRPDASNAMAAEAAAASATARLGAEAAASAAAATAAPARKSTFPSRMPQYLAQMITHSFGSFDTLRREMLLTAQAMHGPGFVWLVRAGKPPDPPSSGKAYASSGGDWNVLRILPTYLAGSPYPETHWRRQAQLPQAHNQLATRGNSFRSSRPSSAMSNFTSTDDHIQGAYSGRELHAIRSSVAAGGEPAAQASTADVVEEDSGGTGLDMHVKYSRPPGGVWAVPLLCVSVWEHAYLIDWGLYDADSSARSGKSAFLNRWWRHIDWQAVSARSVPVAGAQRSQY